MIDEQKIKRKTWPLFLISSCQGVLKAMEGASDPQKRKGFMKGALPERSLAGGFTFFDGNEGSY